MTYGMIYIVVAVILLFSLSAIYHEEISRENDSTMILVMLFSFSWPLAFPAAVIVFFVGVIMFAGIKLGEKLAEK